LSYAFLITPGHGDGKEARPRLEWAEPKRRSHKRGKDGRGKKGRKLIIILGSERTAKRGRPPPWGRNVLHHGVPATATEGGIPGLGVTV